MMSDLMSTALELTIQTTALGILIWLAARLAPIRRAAQRRALLVAGVIAFAALPGLRLLPASWRAFDWSFPLRTAEILVPAESPARPSPTPALASTPKIPDEITLRVTPPSSGQAKSPLIRRSAESRLPVWLLGAWAIGLVYFLGKLALDARYLGRFRARSLPADAKEISSLAEAVRRSGASRAPELRVHPGTDQPVVMGVWRPTILLPPGLSDRLCSETLVDLLVHELGHVRRHDIAVGWLQRLVSAALWPQPLIHWLGRQLDLAKEIACDDDVVRSGGVPARYARALLSIAEGKARPPRSPSLASAILSRRGDLERRVALTLDASRARQRHSGRLLTALPVIAAILVAMLVCCGEEARPFNPKEQQEIAPPVRPEDVLLEPWPGTSVLLVQGTPNWEYRYLKNLLVRESNDGDSALSLQSWLTSADAGWEQESSNDRDALTALPPELTAYGLVILGDPDPEALRGSWGADLSELARWVESGGLLLIVPQSGVPDSLAELPIKEWLPSSQPSEAREVDLGAGGLAIRPVGQGRVLELLIEDTWRLRHPESEVSHELLWRRIFEAALAK